MVSKHNYDKKNIEHLTLIPPFKEDTMTKTEMQHLFQNIFKILFWTKVEWNELLRPVPSTMHCT